MKRTLMKPKNPEPLQGSAGSGEEVRSGEAAARVSWHENLRWLLGELPTFWLHMAWSILKV